MLAQHQSKTCTLFHGMANAYVDGELLCQEQAELLDHLQHCIHCREYVAWLRAMRESLKKTATARAPKASTDLHRKAMLAIQKNRLPPRREPKQFDQMIGKPALALATAAGFLAAMAADTPRWRHHGAEVAKANTLPTTSFEKAIEDISSAMNLKPNLDSLLDDLVELHRKPPRPETTDFNVLARFDTEVGIPIRKPALPSMDAHFEGGRLYATQRARAVQFQYRVASKHRFSLYMLDPQVLRSAISAGLLAEYHNETPVYVGHRHGFSVAAAERNGVGIAVAGDLNEDETTRVVLTALHR